MEGMGVEASPWRQMPVRLPNQVPWRRSFGPARRMVNSETLICSLAPRIMAKPELPALHQPRPSSELLSSMLSRDVGA